MTFEEFKKELIIALKKEQVEAYEIFAQIGQSQSIASHKGEIKKFSSGTTIGVNLKCIINGRVGYASTEKLEKEEAYHLAKTAKNNAQFLPEDPDETLFSDSETIGLSTSDFSYTDSHSLEKKVLAMEAAAKDYSEKIEAVSHCQMAEGATKTFLVNSKGLDKARESQIAYAVVGSVAKDESDTYNQFEQASAPSIAALDTQKIGEKASELTLKYLGAQPLKTGNYNVVLQNDTAIDLLSTFCDIFSTENTEKGLSLLKDKIGLKIAGNAVTLKDSPYHKESGLNCQFDDQGVPVKEKNIIEKGVLKTLLNNVKWANNTKTELTGNGFKGGYSSPVSISPCNFYIEKGTSTKEELLNTCKEGVLITSLGGLHAGANVSTGDFSLEAKGFFISEGKVSHPLKAFTVSGNFYNILKDIDTVGNDLYFDIPGTHTVFGSPSLLIKGLSLAGQ